MNGTLEILNVGAGDIKVSFDTQNCAEAIRAKRIITDMLHRGYALLVEVSPGKWKRATGFDATKGEYLIADMDPIEAAEHDSKEAIEEAQPAKGRKRGKYRKAMEKVKTTAVARSAGGPVENQS